MSSDVPDPYRELFERSADAILIIEGDRFVDCNQATLDMLRYRSKEELFRTHPSELSPPKQRDGRDSYDKANEMMATAFEKGSHRFEWDHLRADGEVFPVEVLLTVVPRGDTHILHVVWRDITERKQLEEQLLHAQKMEAIGKLAGGIAHDFNNLLVAILGNGDILRQELEGRPALVEYVREIQQAGERAAGLVRRLLAFSRKEAVELAVLDLVEVLEGLQWMLQRLIGEDIRLEKDIPEGPIHVRSNRGRMEQAVVSLASNARDAMPAGGTLHIALHEVRIGADGGDAIDPLPPGLYAALSVSDTGEGMEEHVRRRAIEPFFTTKGIGEGTGLGLSTAYGAATQAGGSVQFRSRPGEGTTVTLYLCEVDGEPDVAGGA